MTREEAIARLFYLVAKQAERGLTDAEDAECRGLQESLEHEADMVATYRG